MDSKKLRIAENALRQIAAGQRDPSPTAQAFWRTIPCEGSEPTPEEVILHLADEARRRMSGGNF